MKKTLGSLFKTYSSMLGHEFTSPMKNNILWLAKRADQDFCHFLHEYQCTGSVLPSSVQLSELLFETDLPSHYPGTLDSFSLHETVRLVNGYFKGYLVFLAEEGLLSGEAKDHGIKLVER